MCEFALARRTGARWSRCSRRWFAAATDRVSVDAVTEVDRRVGPSRIDREARQRQVSVYANLDGTTALGDAMTQVEQIAAEVVAESSSDVRYGFGGTAKMMEESMVSMLFSLILAVLCVYMILAAQFESFIHPITIMTALPFSLIGAFGGLLAVQMDMTIFAMIGLIMLFGLVTKNAILLVDFAIQKQGEGLGVREALVEAGATRLRPILMTTAAMIFGMLPVAIGHGDGGELRAPMGVVIIGGLITSTILTLVLVPVVFSFVEQMRVAVGRLRQRFTRRPSLHDVVANA